MHLRSILSGTLAVLLVSSTTFAAQNQAGPAQPQRWGGLFGVFERKTDRSANDAVVVAQASDPRVTALEEQIRSLNGKIEELNFQILQMQEQMRKSQEDYEFRLQELEKKKSGDAGTDKSRNVAGATAGDDTPAVAADTQDAGTDAGAAGEADAPATDEPQDDAQATATDDTPGTGAPPRDFGTITVDKDGNVTSTTVEPPVDLLPPKQAKQGKDNINVAALPKTGDPEELYRNSYQSILSGDYAAAESGFRDYIARFPKDAKIADSNYWLGESLLGQKKYRDAAEVFLAASKAYPKSKKGPDMLLKLGVSLVGLNQKDVACATFAEVGKRYPDASEALKQRVKQEQAFAAC